MREGNTMQAATLDSITVEGRRVDYRLIHSKAAKKLRVRVGVSGVEVIQPQDRNGEQVSDFLEANAKWIVDQLDRIERFRTIRRPRVVTEGAILYRGEHTAVAVENHAHQGGPNQVTHDGARIVIIQTGQSGTPLEKTLENWLRKQARTELFRQLDIIARKLRRQPGKVFVMGQRTKWGNCSALQNLSFNWRLIMAPEFVLRYIVTHEAVHLAVPDHSHKFWLTVQSLCPETERARQWLSANSHLLVVDLREICKA
jgi:predicted metal-dependent hydrolase